MMIDDAMRAVGQECLAPLWREMEQAARSWAIKDDYDARTQLILACGRYYNEHRWFEMVFSFSPITFKEILLPIDCVTVGAYHVGEYGGVRGLDDPKMRSFWFNYLFDAIMRCKILTPFWIADGYGREAARLCLCR